LKQKEEISERILPISSAFRLVTWFEANWWNGILRLWGRMDGLDTEEPKRCGIVADWVQTRKLFLAHLWLFWWEESKCCHKPWYDSIIL